MPRPYPKEFREGALALVRRRGAHGACRRCVWRSARDSQPRATALDHGWERSVRPMAGFKREVRPAAGRSRSWGSCGRAVRGRSPAIRGREGARPVLEYVWIGFWHMVGGWDHLLFILGVVLLAGSWRSAAKLISLSSQGHSLTLLVATVAGWKLDPTLVDVLIALSLVYVGVQGLRGRPERLWVMGVIVFAFGLAHGLGLSTRLQDLGLPDDGVVVRVLLFNVGVELGQLSALGLIAGLGSVAV